MRVAIYARYSSERQNDRSIADQVSVCTRHAVARGWDVVGVHSDAAISGAAMANRPGLLAALDAAERGDFDALLAEDEDRLARSLEHLAHVVNRLRAAGVAVSTLQTDVVETLHVAFKGLIAEDYLRNLSAKTRRGMQANAEAGLATGSRVYGYRSAPGGALQIVEAEAAVVRRVFAAYAAGATPRQIAADLNRDRVPGPRGGMWNASTLNGSVQRGNGLLNLETYAGVKVWNRVAMTKDAKTGKRISRPRPESEWRRTPVPQLAIVDLAVWAAVRERKAREAGARPRDLVQRRPGPFSGLFKCGCCGASYTAYTGGRLICAGHRERGAAACTNSRTVNRDELEARVLDGLRERLLAPDLVAAYVQAYREEWRRRRASHEDRRAPIARRLAELNRQAERIVDAIARGTAGPALEARLVALEAERLELQVQLEVLDRDAEPPVEFHPRAAEAYAERIGRLQQRLAEAAAGEAADDQAAVQAVRELVDRIEVTPRTADRAAPVDLVLHGRLAAFVRPMSPGAAPAPCMGKVVAGGGIEPPTCGL
jgi:site-specific DNA recombinase